MVKDFEKLLDPVAKTCEICGEVFPSWRKQEKYCSEKCSAEARRRKSQEYSHKYYHSKKSQSTAAAEHGTGKSDTSASR